jgi:4-amino-4-deoxy-L-arabinose transferase-like glycosyltransferase
VNQLGCCFELSDYLDGFAFKYPAAAGRRRCQPRPGRGPHGRDRRLVTLKVNGIRYLEKPPLPYWIVAGLYKVFGENAFATHLPNALAVLGCAWLAWLWCRRAWGDRAALYAALGTLTACGPFLYTRFFIPEALLSFLLLLALYCFITGLESRRPGRFYIAWAALALAMLTKGLIAPVFFFAAVIPLLL